MCMYVFVCMLILEPMMILKEALMTCGGQVSQSIEALLEKACSQVENTTAGKNSYKNIYSWQKPGRQYMKVQMRIYLMSLR